MRRRRGLGGFVASSACVAVLAVAGWAAEGCGSSGSSNGSPDGGAHGDDASTAADANSGADGTVGTNDAMSGDDRGSPSDATPPVIDAGPPCDPDAAVDIDCTGKCGPVHDACSGATKMCGGCDPLPTADGGTQVQVCDLTTNTCTTPKVTCAELGAQCGTARNSCGQFLDCPDGPTKGCPDGQECNPDTNQCQACENVTCADLGYECGFAWLGCGPNVENTDCGQCAPDADGGARVCNPTFNRCEPKCTPGSAATLCAAAKTASGVECGFITDGCGGIVECDSNVTGFGCPAGETCGVQGIANHCDPAPTPDECVAMGRTCGDITSSCTGQKIHCGDCTTGQVCNSDGLCGAPCAAKTCADFAQYQCGTFPDGCGGNVTCGTCPNGVCDQSTNTCCATKACSTDYAGQCGTAIPNGCGQGTESCACAAGTCTADGGAGSAVASGVVGACCVAHPATFYSSKNECGTALADGCGGTVNVNCPSGDECVANSTGAAGAAPAKGVIGSCCKRTDSCNLTSGTCGPIQDSCRPTGTTTTCNKCTTGTICSSGNTCCQGAPACSAGTGGTGSAGSECNDMKLPVTSGCGSNVSCTCKSGLVCVCSGHVCGTTDGAGVCTTPLTCTSSQYSGKCGTNLDNGAGGTISTCGCPSGQVCSSTASGVTGTCQCNTPSGQAYTCANVPTKGSDACGTYADGCGGTLTCPCPSGEACNTKSSPHVCCQPATCPTPAAGSACGSVTNSCTTVSCGCPSGAGNANFQCVSGTCQCTKDTCRGRTGPQPDLCGGTLQCGG
jgi:hypothetical protein